MAGIGRLFGITGSALAAQRARIEATTANIANANTTRTPEGGPYKAQHVVFSSAFGADGKPAGVAVSGVVTDNTTITVHDPGHADADEDGNVLMPNVDTVSEITDLIEAQRAYQLNTNVFQVTRGMFARALDILR